MNFAHSLKHFNIFCYQDDSETDEEEWIPDVSSPSKSDNKRVKTESGRSPTQSAVEDDTSQQEIPFEKVSVKGIFCCFQLNNLLLQHKRIYIFEITIKL